MRRHGLTDHHRRGDVYSEEQVESSFKGLSLQLCFQTNRFQQQNPERSTAVLLWLMIMINYCRRSVLYNVKHALQSKVS